MTKARLTYLMVAVLVCCRSCWQRCAPAASRTVTRVSGCALRPRS